MAHDSDDTGDTGDAGYSGDSGDSSGASAEFGDSLQWSEVDEDEERRRAEDPARRRRVRALVAVCVAGGIVIVVLTVLGVRALVSDLDERAPTSRERTVAAIKERYQKSYDACVSRGGRTEPCSEQAARACVTDTRWRDDEAETLTQTCVFGPRR